MPNPDANTPVWFVGASFGGSDDQLPRFLADGIWENGYTDRFLDEVKSMRPGDRIAIKSSYTRKHNLPFDNRHRPVSVMAIKAIGRITGNPGDGRHVRVDWQRLEPFREWYFYTNRSTLWSVMPGKWMADALIAFAFDGRPQEYQRFLSHPYWRDRYQDPFEWTEFYEAVASRLLDFRNDRGPLIEGIHRIAARVPGPGYLTDRFADGSTGPLKDICPFTAMGTFNRSLTVANRRAIAAEMSRLLELEVSVPETFEGIPLLNNQRSWFFANAAKRRAGDIDALWDVFAAAHRLVEDDGPQAGASSSPGGTRPRRSGASTGTSPPDSTGRIRGTSRRSTASRAGTSIRPSE